MLNIDWPSFESTLLATIVGGVVVHSVTNKLDKIAQLIATRTEAIIESSTTLWHWARRMILFACFIVLIFESIGSSPLTRAALRNVIVSLVVLVSVYLLDLLRVLETLVRLHPPPNQAPGA